MKKKVPIFQCEIFHVLQSHYLCCSFLLSVGPSGPKPVLSVNVAEEINSGDYVTFTCITEGIKSNPGLTIVKWTKNGEDCDWPKSTFNHTAQVTTSGNYSCMVGNVINSNDTYSDTSEQVELKVKAAEGETKIIPF